MTRVVFACVHNAGRSQIAAAFFNSMADGSKARAVSAGTQPGDRVHPEVVAVMKEVSMDLSNAQPQRLSLDLARGASLLVTMGCGDECPVVPGARRDDWPLPDRRACRSSASAQSATRSRAGWNAFSRRGWGLSELATKKVISESSSDRVPGAGGDFLAERLLDQGHEHGAPRPGR